MRYLNYEFLQQLHKSVKPYRGSNRYPMWDRGHRHKYMIPVVENGKTEYHVCYYWKYDKTLISETEYDAIQDPDIKQEYSLYGADNKNNPVYYKQERVPNVLAIVREDNTIEFVANYLGQGDRYYLTQLSRGHFWSDVRRGGVLYRDISMARTVPIFKNLRIHADTLKTYEHNTYEIVSRRVDRAKAKKAMQEYSEPLKTAEVMFKVMSKESFYMLVHEENLAVSDVMADVHWQDRNEKYMKLGVDKIKTDEVAGSILLMLGSYNSGLAWRAQRYAQEGITFGNDSEAIQYYEMMTSQFKRVVYIGSQAFFEEVYKVGERLPSSRWSIDFLINGEKTSGY